MSAEKTLDILDLYDEQIRSFTVQQMAEKLQQPQSSVYRHIRILKEKGYLIETGDKQYRLGYRFLKMARMVRSDHCLMTVARPEMERLMAKTKETIILSVRSNYHAVCLETINSIHPIKVSSAQGGIMPLHCGASSKVLLAHMGEAFVDQLFEKGMIEKFQENTIYEKKALLDNLALIRQNGYAFSDSEIDSGVVTYAVPIYDFQEKVAASLSVAGPRKRMLQQDGSFFINELKNTARTIGEFL